MKFKLILTVLAAFALAGQTLAGQSGKGRKVLVAYFSWSGNTRELAGQIAEAAGADIYEIVPAKAYPSDYEHLRGAGQAREAGGCAPCTERETARNEEL